MKQDKLVKDVTERVLLRLRRLELKRMNVGFSSSGFNNAMDGGGQSVWKDETDKWNYTADYLTGRLGMNSIFLRLLEQSAAGADVAGWGQLWVLDSDPNELWFTDDAGNSMLIASLTNNITVIDADDVNIADALNIITATEVEAALQEIKALVDTNTTHIGSDGKDHSDVVLNNTHRGSSSDPHNTLSGGISGVLILDDGANWRVTLTFTDGKLTTQVVAGTTAALAQWT